MAQGGYTTADVVVVHAGTPNLPAIRAKFLREHTHTEDEVRFFVEGHGDFWFNLGGGEPVLCARCEVGDLLSVPKGTRHWFDLGEPPHVKAIRVFIDASGWVPACMGSRIEERYCAAALAAAGLLPP
jgi:1,2-dihydroxy-3-keto-5-methylthiopentene dioxygenase